MAEVYDHVPGMSPKTGKLERVIAMHVDPQGRIKREGHAIANRARRDLQELQRNAFSKARFEVKRAEARIRLARSNGASQRRLNQLTQQLDVARKRLRRMQSSRPRLEENYAVVDYHVSITETNNRGVHSGGWHGARNRDNVLTDNL